MIVYRDQLLLNLFLNLNDELKNDIKLSLWISLKNVMLLNESQGLTVLCKSDLSSW